MTTAADMGYCMLYGTSREGKCFIAATVERGNAWEETFLLGLSSTQWQKFFMTTDCQMDKHLLQEAI